MDATEKTIFELSANGRKGFRFPSSDVPASDLPESLLRKELPLPELSEVDVVRHYTRLSRLNYSLDNGMYPLGSCTMKYNPKICEKAARISAFANLHPLQPIESVQGAILILYEMQIILQEISGFPACSLTPAAGAQGEFGGVKMIAASLRDRGEMQRRIMLIPDSAHGTNPASSVMSGFECLAVRTDERGNIDLNDLTSKCNEQLAGIMITNPNTLGLFDENIVEVIRIVHQAGGLVYGDGANMNALLGIVKPAELGFDVMHFNLRTTTVVGDRARCHLLYGKKLSAGSDREFWKKRSKKYPTMDTVCPKKYRNLRSFWVFRLLSAYCYCMMLGAEGFRRSPNMHFKPNYLMEVTGDYRYRLIAPACMNLF